MRSRIEACVVLRSDERYHAFLIDVEKDVFCDNSLEINDFGTHCEQPWQIRYFFCSEMHINIYVFKQFTKVWGRLTRLQGGGPNPGEGVWCFLCSDMPINTIISEQFTKVWRRLTRLQGGGPNPGGGVRGGLLYYGIVLQLYCVQYEASTRFGPLASADDGKHRKHPEERAAPLEMQVGLRCAIELRK